MPSFDPVRFGLIGSGWITERHLEARRVIPEVEVVACADYPPPSSAPPPVALWTGSS